MMKKILKIILFAIPILLTSNILSIKTIAISNGRQLYGALYRNSEGSNYWHTSNLREWLNSEGNVNYTNKSPSSDYLGKYAYDKKQGFLSNFTTSEKNSIAVTNLTSTLSSFDASALGISPNQNIGVFNHTKSIAFNIPDILGRWDGLSKKSFNDKVFVLSPKELIYYYQQRGWDVIKEVTPEVRQQYAITTTFYNYHTRSARTEGYSERIYGITANSNSPIAEMLPSSSIGVSPAMHLKPNKTVKLIKKYNINNLDSFEWNNVNQTINTNDLNIGDIIEFGTYLGKPIEWRVINISENGYPLISTEKLIDIMAFDTPGDNFSYEYSNIQFDNPDVVLNDNYFKNIQKSNDNIIPTVKVFNEDELYSRKNGSFTLKLEMSDASNIYKVILPDGSVYKNPPSIINYTVANNGYYHFQIVDTKGNYKHFIIPVGNINVETSVMVNSNTNEWTNKDVNVNIVASNDINFSINYFDLNGRDTFYNLYPNYTSYAGKTFKISADVELLFAKKDVGNFSTGMGFHYYYTTKSGNDYVRNPTWIRGISIPLSDLQQNGKRHIEFEFTIPTNYFNELIGWSQIDVDHSERAYAVKYSNVKYELLDDSDFKITKIELPNGEIINNKAYSYSIAEEGVIIHKYKIHDNRGMINEKSIITKIDKTIPSITHSEIPKEYTNENIYLDFTFADNLSGIKEIVTPFEVIKLSGQKEYKKTIVFEKNGVYSFKIIDLAGNEIIKNININTIDKTPPIINIDKIINSNKLSGYLNITVTDNEVIDEIILPNNERTTSNNIQYPLLNNGFYMVTARDKANNKTTSTIEVNEIITNIVSSDISKIEYKLEGATIQNWTVYDSPFVITNEGITTIRARVYDKAGNLSDEKISIVKIDKTKPINNSVIIRLK
ncbi:MAG: hypothetical protein GX889_05080 [Clostridiales bacterium]|nr:hypothetical protein [Clostridiales bacterium]